MKWYTRLVCLLGALALVASVAWCLYLRGLLVPADRAAALQEMEAARLRADALEEQRQRTLCWREGKVAVARDLIAQRLTLPEAAARFRALDRDFPEFNWHHFRQIFPGASDGERHCRHVIAYAAGLLIGRPEEAAEVRDRLEAQLRDLLERDGTVQLPEGPGD